MHRKFFLGLFALTSLTAGCVASPYHGQNIGNLNSAVTFRGCSVEPDVLIEIQRCKFISDDSWRCSAETVATTKSSSTPTFVEAQGSNWYCWEKTTPISDPTTQHDVWYLPLDRSSPRAMVRVRDHSLTASVANRGLAYHYENPYEQCPYAWGSAQFTNKSPCAVLDSPTSPEQDYFEVTAERSSAAQMSALRDLATSPAANLASPLSATSGTTR